MKTFKPRIVFYTCGLSLLVGMSMGGPARAANYLSKAEQYLAAGQPRTALIELNNEVQTDPQDGQAQYMLAKLNLQLGDPISAQRAARAAIAIGYEPNRSLSELLLSYLAQNQAIELLHEFPVGTASGERAARIAYARGEADLVLRQTDDATANFTAAAKFDPQLSLVYFGEEDLALSQHNIGLARRYLEQGLALDESAPEGRLRDAQLLILENRPAAAMQILTSLTNAWPSDVLDRLVLIQALLQENQFQPAQEEVSQVLSAVPNEAQAMDDQASLDVATQNWKAAQEDLQRISPNLAQFPNGEYLQALTLSHFGLMAAAGEAAARYAAQNPTDPHGPQLVAEIALKNGQGQQAQADIASLSDDQLTVPFFLVQRGAEHQQAGAYAAAGADFARAVAIDPQDTQALIALGNIDLLGGNAAGATTALEQAVKVAPDNIQAQHLLFRAAFDAGELDEARQVLVALRSVEGADAEPELAGEIDLATFHLAAAKAAFEIAVSDHPAAADPQIGLARISGLQGDTMTEETELREVLQQDPANLVAVELLVGVLASKGQIGDAGVILAHAHQDDPKNLKYILQMVQLDLVTKRSDQAQALLNSLDGTLADSPPIIEEKIQIALATGKVNEARSLLGVMTDQNPKWATGPLTLARLDAQAGDLKNAEATLDQAILVNPHDFTLMAARAEFTLKESGMSVALAEAQNWAAAPTHLPEALAIPGQLYLTDNLPLKAADAFGAAYGTSGSPSFLLLEIATLEGIQPNALSSQQNALTKSKLSDALVKARSALSTNPKQPGLLEALAQVDIANGQFEQAQEELTRALSIRPSDVDALNNLAFVEDQLHVPDAELLASRAYFLSPTPAISDTLGWILFENKNYGSALLLLSSAYQGLPTDPDVTYHYASVLAATGNRAKAIALLKPLATSSDQTSTTTMANALLSKLAFNQ